MFEKAEKQKRIENEIKRVSRLVTANTELAKKLIAQAAWEAVSVEELEQDINENGYSERFTQSVNTPDYERERPAVRQISTFQKNYLSTMKLLATNFVAPKEEKKVDTDEEAFRAFITSKK